jgi:hypothetical protein
MMYPNENDPKPDWGIPSKSLEKYTISIEVLKVVGFNFSFYMMIPHMSFSLEGIKCKLCKHYLPAT